MSAPSESSAAVVAEKPSVARDIARVLGADRRGQGFLHGSGWIVTWAIGHLASPAEPHEINPAWKKWRRSDLPILPDAWPLTIYERTRDQFEVVRRILTSPKVDRVVCATDAGREGELIFRYVVEAAGCDKPFERLWISSLTPEAVRAGFARLRPGSDFDRLADAARARSRADWLVGMNLSRAYSLDYDEDFSVGRVQTPTLAMLVERELEIRNFAPEDYFEVQAKFDADSEASYLGTRFVEREGKRETRLPADGEEAARVAERVRAGRARIESVEREKKTFKPPQLHDLTELQRQANRLFGFSADRTLGAAQSLYERWKLITYPRTDSRHLSRDVAAGLPAVVAAVAEPFRALLAPGTGEKPLGKRWVDDSKVSDHHAIIPTGRRGDAPPPDSDEGRIFDLVARRLLMAWQPDNVRSITTVLTAVESSDAVDRFHSSGTSIEREGWTTLEVRGGEPQDETALPGGLQAEQDVRVAAVDALKKQTRPPRRFTEATLLTAMESAGRSLDDEALSEAMKERGLGTPATRAAIIETLLKRGYIVRRGKALEATDKGVRLIALAHPKVKSPLMTGEWEAELKAIERGKADFNDFMRRIEEYVREVVGAPAAPREPRETIAPSPPAVVGLAESAKRVQRHATVHDARVAETTFGRPRPANLFDAAAAAPRAERAPVDAGRLGDLLRSAFGFESFRPHQEDVCRSVVEGRDVLLVMPTGAGKSLCYQLPGLARGGATLVISPLIALMEDQVAKLRELGLRAERIHSGRSRQDSRQVCFDYLEGRLDYLFIAPERLAVPGFPEMLAKRKPALAAIDEAHCISQWGHDFRPDYRMLGQRLPLLRPTPVIAVTATATPIVQDDIVEQLGLIDPLRSIHGFRRSNIAIEVVELTPSQRIPAVLALLEDPGRRPAIVYAPTRKAADQQAAEFGVRFPTAAYHAGMTAAQRDRVQTGFLGGRYDVIVATIAFGMGIDKADIRTVIHTGLPGSVEGYYQEIGRAGRDGLPSLAVLMHSWNDRRTHEFFVDRDYPDVAELRKIFDALSDEPRSRSELERRFDLDAQVFEKALEKLWIHGGALVDPEENVRRGEPGWRAPYLRQREHKLEQLHAISRFTESHGCRMLDLVGHFGDREDSHRPCGRCDVCAPEECSVQRRRDPTPEEARALDAILGALRERDGVSTGRLFRELFEGSDIDRKRFEGLLTGLARAGYVGVFDDSFERAGEVIAYRRASLTHEGRQWRDSVAPHVTLIADAPPAPKKKRERAAKTKARSETKAPRRDAAAGRSRKAAAATDGGDPVLTEALRAWRLAEARRRGVPAFQIFSNRALTALAESRPRDEEALLQVAGIGPAVAKKYGEKLLAIIENVGQTLKFS